MVILLSYLAQGLTSPVRSARPCSPPVARGRRPCCVPPALLDSSIPPQVRPFVRHLLRAHPGLPPVKSAPAVAPAAPLRAPLSPLVSRAASGPSAIAADSRAGQAGMAPRSPDNATSLPRRWQRATTDKPLREASAGTRQHRTSLVDSQFLDLARIRRYTASSGERLLLNSSEHGARPTIAAASFLLRSYPVGAVATAFLVAPQRPTLREPSPQSLRRDHRRFRHCNHPTQ